ncbi:MAG: hypothetical protein Kow0059_16520 [Candidatus Sumerlaeia bacterium]
MRCVSSIRGQGFTLIEILIVGILISLFAGLAIFNIQETYKANLRKATIGEVRQLGTAMALAHQDLGVFPKIPLLMFSNTQMRREGIRLTGSEDFWFANVDAFRNEPGFSPLAFRLKQDWGDTAYFAASQTRKTVSGGGVVIMDYGQIPGQNGPVQVQLEWPSDAWGNPYVFYSLSVDPATGQYSFPASATEFGNYFIGIVSYGPNGVPGANGDLLTEGLFLPGSQPGVFQALTRSQYDATRANAITKILDVDGGSDDIVFPF